VRTRPLITTAALLAVLASGCGGTDLTPDPSPSPSPTATTSATVAPPMPPAATAHTKAGAIAFVRHYVDLINYTQSTGDVGPIHRAEGPHCSSCKSANGYIERLYSRGGRIDGGTAKVKRVIDALRNAETDGYSIDIVLKSGPQTVHDPGKPIAQLEGAELVATVQVSPTGHGWLVEEWTRAQ